MVSYSVLMPGAVVESGAVVQYAIVGEDCRIGRDARVGAPPETAQDPDDWGVAVLGTGTVIGDGAIVVRQDSAGPASRKEVTGMNRTMHGIIFSYEKAHGGWAS